MDRKLARRNIVMGISMFVAICGLLSFTFIWATLFLSFVK
jgi:hypothetical protein